MAVALSEQSPDRFSFLQPLWHRGAPRRLTERIPGDDPIAGWTAWSKHLAQRRAPRRPPFSRGKRPALLWGCADGRLDIAHAAAKALATPEVPLAVDVADALQTLGLAYALPGLAKNLSADSWWRLVQRLYELAAAAREARVDWRRDPAEALRQQLLAGELPLALGYLFPEVRALRALRESARAVFSESILELTDGQGLPHARLLGVFLPLWACWTRARWLGGQLKRGAWSREAESQYKWLVQHVLRLVDADGQPMLVPREHGASPTQLTKLFSTALELVDDKEHWAIAAAALPRRAGKRDAARSDNLPAPSLESDWAGICVLAGGWSRSATRLALAFADDPVRIELSLGRDKLLAGDWACHTECDGAAARVVGEWEQLCWESDERFDLLELGVDLSDGLRLERQLLLARDERVLYLADIVSTADGAPRELRHAFQLPLAGSVVWRPEIDTRDGVLLAGRRPAAVLPLALREWRSDPRGGSLTLDSRRLMLSQQTSGRALCCPLLIDLKPRRTRRERTWRQLTVGEALQAVPSDEAVAFRAQSGSDQWLFYRSLGPAGNRTFLGQNIAGEFAAGPFRPTGKFKPWVEIEAV